MVERFEEGGISDIMTEIILCVSSKGTGRFQIADGNIICAENWGRIIFW